MLSPVLLKCFLTLTALSRIPPSRQNLPENAKVLYKIPVLNQDCADTWRTHFQNALRLMEPVQTEAPSSGRPGRSPKRKNYLKNFWETISKALGVGSSNSHAPAPPAPSASPPAIDLDDPVYQLPTDSTQAMALVEICRHPPNQHPLIPYFIENDVVTNKYALERQLWEFVKHHGQTSHAEVDRQLPDAIIQATEYMLNKDLSDDHLLLWMHIFGAATRIGRYDLPFTHNEITLDLAMRNLELKYSSRSGLIHLTKAFRTALDARRNAVQDNPTFRKAYEHNRHNYPGAEEILYPQLGLSNRFRTWEELHSYIQFDYHLVELLSPISILRINSIKTYNSVLEGVMGLVWTATPNSIQSKIAALNVLHFLLTEPCDDSRSTVAEKCLKNLSLDTHDNLLPEIRTLLETITGIKKKVDG